jgi:hypothetical protein
METRPSGRWWRQQLLHSESDERVWRTLLRSGSDEQVWRTQIEMIWTMVAPTAATLEQV